MAPRTAIIASCLVASALAVCSCSGPPGVPGEVKDEAMAAGKTGAFFKAADEDYFADMDYGYRRASDPGVVLKVNEVRGRNTWIAWTFGSDWFWDYMANNTFGAFDLLKIVSSSPDVGYCTETYSGKHEM